MVRHLSGLYMVGPYRIWKITAYGMREPFIFAGTKDDAKKAAVKIVPSNCGMPSVREISKSMQ